MNTIKLVEVIHNKTTTEYTNLTVEYQQDSVACVQCNFINIIIYIHTYIHTYIRNVYK